MSLARVSPDHELESLGVGPDVIFGVAQAGSNVQPEYRSANVETQISLEKEISVRKLSSQSQCFLSL